MRPHRAIGTGPQERFEHDKRRVDENLNCLGQPCCNLVQHGSPGVTVPVACRRKAGFLSIARNSALLALTGGPGSSCRTLGLAGFLWRGRFFPCCRRSLPTSCRLPLKWSRPLLLFLPLARQVSFQRRLVSCLQSRVSCLQSRVSCLQSRVSCLQSSSFLSSPSGFLSSPSGFLSSPSSFLSSPSSFLSSPSGFLSSPSALTGGVKVTLSPPSVRFCREVANFEWGSSVAGVRFPGCRNVRKNRRCGLRGIIFLFDGLQLGLFRSTGEIRLAVFLRIKH